MERRSFLTFQNRVCQLLRPGRSRLRFLHGGAGKVLWNGLGRDVGKLSGPLVPEQATEARVSTGVYRLRGLADLRHYYGEHAQRVLEHHFHWHEHPSLAQMEAKPPGAVPAG